MTDPALRLFLNRLRAMLFIDADSLAGMATDGEIQRFANDPAEAFVRMSDAGQEAVWREVVRQYPDNEPDHV